MPYCFASLGIYAAWTKISTFAPVASNSLKDISTRRWQLSPTTTPMQPRFGPLTQRRLVGEIPREPRDHCLPQVADLLHSVQGAICRAARSNTCTILPRLDEDRRTFACKEDIFRLRLFEALENRYDSFPVCRKRGRSLLVERIRASAFSRRFTA